MVISSSVTRKLVTPSPLEKAFGENRFIRALPFRKIKLPDKSKFYFQFSTLNSHFSMYPLRKFYLYSR